VARAWVDLSGWLALHPIGCPRGLAPWVGLAVCAGHLCWPFELAIWAGRLCRLFLLTVGAAARLCWAFALAICVGNSRWAFALTVCACRLKPPPVWRQDHRAV